MRHFACSVDSNDPHFAKAGRRALQFALEAQRDGKKIQRAAAESLKSSIFPPLARSDVPCPSRSPLPQCSSKAVGRDLLAAGQDCGIDSSSSVEASCAENARWSLDHTIAIPAVSE
eukprot:3170516-Pyramimonas_sp.AAC.1